jgi:branched-chain amino acid transport system ATP-binding protein
MSGGLELRALCKRFGGVVAADDVNMSVPPGRITGLIGPNGAGKTTIVNLVTGMLSVTSGTITFDGRDLTHAPAHEIARAGLARTFQNIRLMPEASILDNVMVGFHRHETSGLLSAILRLPSAARETRETRAKAMALIERFGLTALADHPAGGLSYGHQRRVEIMRALATDPRLILLDEPVAGMNDVESAEMAEVIRALAAEGRAILLIEHDMRFVTGLCDHVYALDGGRLIAEGTARAVLSDPVVIEAYLGSPLNA